MPCYNPFCNKVANCNNYYKTGCNVFTLWYFRSNPFCNKIAKCNKLPIYVLISFFSCFTERESVVQRSKVNTRHDLGCTGRWLIFILYYIKPLVGEYRLRRHLRTNCNNCNKTGCNVITLWYLRSNPFCNKVAQCNKLPTYVLISFFHVSRSE